MTLWTAMAVLKSRPPLQSLTLRQCRHALGLTQARFAEDLGVALETYRTWDSGRRRVPSPIITRANTLAVRYDRDGLVPVGTVAIVIGVHVRTLHAAAKDGRLRVTYDTRTTFRRLRAFATLADADLFLHSYFHKAVWPATRPAPLDWRQIPADYDDRVRTAAITWACLKPSSPRAWGLRARPSCTNGNLESAVRRRCSGNGSWTRPIPKCAAMRHHRP